MRIKQVSWRLAALAGAVLPLSACGTAAGLSCDEIGRQVTEATKSQPVQIRELRDVREVSKTDTERRCTAVAETSAGTNEVIMIRGYEENGNQLVGWESQGPAQ
jgi:hypothetical protein